jgi:hypothetical protein
MARTLEEIKQSITNRYVSEMATIGVVVDSTNWSATSIERCIIFIFAYCAFILEKMFDTHTAEINDIIANKKPHTKNWYKNIVLAYQHGFVVDATTLTYNNTGVSELVIEQSKVVKYCAVADGTDTLNIKIAKEVAGELAPLSNAQLAGLQDYMEDDQLGQKDAGVYISFINENADALQIGYDVYVNPSVIDINGVHIISGLKTVEVAIKQHLKSLQFNGVFAPQRLEDYIKTTCEGVELLKLRRCLVKPDGATIWLPVDVQYLPNSGYLRIINVNDLSLDYLPN